MREEDRQRRYHRSRIIPSEKMSSEAMGEGFRDAWEGELKIIIVIIVVVMIDVAGIVVDSGGRGDPLRDVTVLDLDDLLLLCLFASFLFYCFFLFC